MIQTASDLHRLQAFEEQPHGLNAMCLAGADVLLLTSGGDDEALATEPGHIPDEGPDAAVEQAVGQIFVAQQAALLAGFDAQPQQASPAERTDPEAGPDFGVLGAGVEGQQDGDFLTFLQRLAGRFVGGHDQQLEASQVELLSGVLQIQGEDLLDGFQDGPRDEGGTVGTVFNLASKETVPRLGIEPSLTQLVLDLFVGQHP
jgi:hypothetical protein